MKKVGRFSLFELEDASSVIDKASQKTFIGGGSGSSTDPYTQDEFDSMMYSGHWNGGFVYGMGWVTPQVYIYPNHYKYAGGYRPSGGGGGGSFRAVVVGLVMEAMQVVIILIIIVTTMDIMVIGGIMVIPIITAIRDFMVIIFMEVA